MSALDEVIYNHNPFSKISLTLSPSLSLISHKHSLKSQPMRVTVQPETKRKHISESDRYCTNELVSFVLRANILKTDSFLTATIWTNDRNQPRCINVVCCLLALDSAQRTQETPLFACTCLCVCHAHYILPRVLE